MARQTPWTSTAKRGRKTCMMNMTTLLRRRKTVRTEMARLKLVVLRLMLAYLLACDL